MKNGTEVAMKGFTCGFFFATKPISGAGVVISGVVIDLAGIQRNATVETIDEDSLHTLAFAMGPGCF